MRLVRLAVATALVTCAIGVTGPVNHSSTDSPSYSLVLVYLGFTTTQESPGGSQVLTCVSRKGGGDADVHSFGQTTSLCNHQGQLHPGHFAFGQADAELDLKIKTKSDRATANGTLIVDCIWTVTFSCDNVLVFFDSDSMGCFVSWGPLPAAPVVGVPAIGRQVKFKTKFDGKKDHIDLRWVLPVSDPVACAFLDNSVLDTTAEAKVRWGGDEGGPLGGIEGDADGIVVVTQVLNCE